MLKGTMKESEKIPLILGACVFLVVLTGSLAYTTRPCSGEACEDFAKWIDKDMTWRSILVGIAAGVSFGFCDNALLFFGISALDSVFTRLPYGKEDLMVAGYGNAFSSTVSAFVSTFIGQVISNVTGLDPDNAPLWAMAVGLAIGGLIGIYVPRMIVGAPKDKHKL